MDFIVAYTNYIEEELNKINIPQKPSGLYDPVRYFLKIGGKRIRPMLTLLGAELFGLKKEDAIRASIAIEAFHNFTLVHDDIMDDAPLRRGNETVHQKWDINSAILSGDILMIMAYQLLGGQKGDLKELLSVFNKAAIEVCEGQQMDMDFETRNDISISEYTEMIRLKTSVLLGGALELSAIIAGASKKDREHIYNFGVNIGLAFQIQDDVLDLYADPKKFGKQVGGDVLANKKTMLYLMAKNNANVTQLERLKQFESETDATKKITATKQLFDEVNAKELSLNMVNHYFSIAQNEMNSIDVPAQNKENLKGLSNFLLNREV